MARTTRISKEVTRSPATEFRLGADIVAQSQSGNYSVVRVSAQAINRGGSATSSDVEGRQKVAIDLYGSLSHIGKMRDGVGGGVERWDDLKDIQVDHLPDGTRGRVTLRQTISGWYGSTEYEDIEYLYGFDRIPKPTSKPGKPQVTSQQPTNIELAWSPPTDNGGSKVIGYTVRYWANKTATGKFIDEYQTGTTTSRTIYDLKPGQFYTFRIIARNGSADQDSPGSTTMTTKTLSGVWMKVAGVWKRVIPYVKVNDEWVVADNIYQKVDGEWVSTG